ncbi:hypothetical protein RRG08_011131 [Elysia crispata]|uniref:Uncharacterized protein n=1 Tax=Elysia crispata TaxID=231223 RepID=A0AAE1A1U3_9GAST|nr:hypothetical protein RRG08_011131 [Elysia crispata]
MRVCPRIRRSKEQEEDDKEGQSLQQDPTFKENDAKLWKCSCRHGVYEHQFFCRRKAKFIWSIGEYEWSLRLFDSMSGCQNHPVISGLRRRGLCLYCGDV